MEMYTEATSEATRDALKRPGEELTPSPAGGADRPRDAADDPAKYQPGEWATVASGAVPGTAPGTALLLYFAAVRA
jgi:hypothetical protein